MVHKDIKPENIMIGHNDEAVLIDFGVAVQVDPDLHGGNEMLNMEAGSRMYFAPELVDPNRK